MSKETSTQKSLVKENKISFFRITKELWSWFFPISIGFGVLSTYSYLSFIGKINFLPEIIEQISVFISIFIIFLIFTLFISAPFLSSFWLTITIRKNKFYIDSSIKKVKSHINFVLITMLSPIIILFTFIILIFFNIEETFLGGILRNIFTILFFLFSLIFFSLYYFLTHKKYSELKYPHKYRNKFSKESFSEISLPLILYSVYSTPILFLTSSTWFAHEEGKLWIILTPFIPQILNVLAANIILFKKKGEPNNTQNMHFFFAIPFVIIFICLIIISMISENLPRSMLNKAYIIELPYKSQWHIINYKNSIIPEKHLKKAKEKFICTPSEFFSCNILPNTHPDFFFGYMAWNLGEKKIFCPYSAQFGADKAENKAFSKMCIIINSDAITPWNEQYIHSPHSPESWL